MVLQSECNAKLEKMQQAMKNVDAADRLKILHLHNDQLNFIRMTNKQISKIWERCTCKYRNYSVYEVYKNDFDKNSKIGCGIGSLPDADRHLQCDSESEFLWFGEVKYHLKECNYFWLDADGEIFPSTADSCNLWLDELGFLVSYHTGKYGEYAERIKMRINCLYNDVNYELVKMKRDKKLYDDKLRSLGVDVDLLDAYIDIE